MRILRHPQATPAALQGAAIALGNFDGVHLGHRAIVEEALKMGADIAIDPREIDPYGELPELGARRVNLIYENVGQKGMLSRIIASASGLSIVIRCEASRVARSSSRRSA